MTSPIIVCGIDPSLTCTAVVTLGSGDGDDRPTLLDVHRIITKPASFTSPMARLVSMLGELRDALEQRPVLVVLEGYAFSRNMAGQHSISEWGGLLRLEMYREHIPYRECSPSSLKKYVCGKGNADKSLMLREVHKRWLFDAADDNEADAYALARLAWDVVTGSGGARAREAEAKLGGVYGARVEKAKPKARKKASAA